MNPLPSRGFTWNIKSYFLWKTMKNIYECCLLQSWLAPQGQLIKHNIYLVLNRLFRLSSSSFVSSVMLLLSSKCILYDWLLIRILSYLSCTSLAVSFICCIQILSYLSCTSLAVSFICCIQILSYLSCTSLAVSFMCCIQILSYLSCTSLAVSFMCCIQILSYLSCTSLAVNCMCCI